MRYLFLSFIMLLPAFVQAAPTLDRECYNYCISRGSDHTICLDTCSNLDEEEGEDGEEGNGGYRRGDIDFECIKECKEHEMELEECREICRNPSGW